MDKKTIGSCIKYIINDKMRKSLNLAENWPNVGLIKEANNRRKMLLNYNLLQMPAYLTKTMGKLCTTPIAWRSIPLDRLNNQTLLMLTGMTTDEGRKLVRAEVGPEGKYIGCECTRNTG